jgi:pimeloyl-ACP methyl ester carboxylesterase
MDMMALLDHLAIDRVIIIGTSLGGLMAMLMAAGFADRIKAILLNDIGAEIAEEGLSKIRGYIDRVPMVNSWQDAERDVESLFGAAFPDYRPADWRRFAQALYREDDTGRPVLDYDPNIAVNVLTGGSAAPALWPIFDALPKIPIAVIRGALSNILAAETLAEMVRRRPELLWVELPRVGHAPDLNELQSRALIAEFLARIDAQQSGDAA